VAPGESSPLGLDFKSDLALLVPGPKCWVCGKPARDGKPLISQGNTGEHVFHSECLAGKRALDGAAKSDKEKKALKKLRKDNQPEYKKKCFRVAPEKGKKRDGTTRSVAKTVMGDIVAFTTVKRIAGTTLLSYNRYIDFMTTKERFVCN